MQQIAHWLKKLGMSEYTQRFVENRIDLSVLPDLTDQDSEKRGFLLLRAIRQRTLKWSSLYRSCLRLGKKVYLSRREI
jgi:hypothetical protein